MEINEKFILDLIGYLAVIISMIGFLTKEKQKMRFYGMFSTLLFGIGIYAYNGLNGLFVSLISFVTKLLSFFINEDKLTFIKYTSPLLAFILFYFFNNEGWVGILPSLSLVFIMLADIQKDILKMKYIYYGSATCWLIYSIILGSIPGIIFDIVGYASITYSVIQIKKERNHF